MKYKSYDHLNCSVAQTLNVVGDRWTLLILRDAFFGLTRFGQFERSLGIAKNILTARLNQLVDEGLMEKRHANGSAHPEYVLTEAGMDLHPALLALTHWGDKHRPNPRGQRLTFTDRKTGIPIRPMGATSASGEPLAPGELGVMQGPGGSDHPGAAGA